MTDIVYRLRSVANYGPNSTYDVRDDTVRIGCSVLRDAVLEILRLRCHERASEKWLAELVPN